MDELQVNEPCGARRFEPLHVAVDEIPAFGREDDRGLAAADRALETCCIHDLDEIRRFVLGFHDFECAIETRRELARVRLTHLLDALAGYAADHRAVGDDFSRHDEHSVRHREQEASAIHIRVFSQPGWTCRAPSIIAPQRLLPEES